MLHKVAERTVGSWVEEKEYTLAWHYRTMEKHLGAHRLRDIRKQLIYLTANLNLQVPNPRILFLCLFAYLFRFRAGVRVDIQPTTPDATRYAFPKCAGKRKLRQTSVPNCANNRTQGRAMLVQRRKRRMLRHTGVPKCYPD